MARRHRAQARRGHRNGRTGRRAAPAEKDTPETQSAQQAEKPPQHARVTRVQRGIMETSILMAAKLRPNFTPRALSERREAPFETGARAHTQLHALFPPPDIGP